MKRKLKILYLLVKGIVVTWLVIILNVLLQNRIIQATTFNVVFSGKLKIILFTLTKIFQKKQFTNLFINNQNFISSKIRHFVFNNFALNDDFCFKPVVLGRELFHNYFVLPNKLKALYGP